MTLPDPHGALLATHTRFIWWPMATLPFLCNCASSPASAEAALRRLVVPSSHAAMAHDTRKRQHEMLQLHIVQTEQIYLYDRVFFEWFLPRQSFPAVMNPTTPRQHSPRLNTSGLLLHKSHGGRCRSNTPPILCFVHSYFWPDSWHPFCSIFY